MLAWSVDFCTGTSHFFVRSHLGNFNIPKNLFSKKKASCRATDPGIYQKKSPHGFEAPSATVEQKKGIKRRNVVRDKMLALSTARDDVVGEKLSENHRISTHDRDLPRSYERSYVSLAYVDFFFNAYG